MAKRWKGPGGGGGGGLKMFLFFAKDDVTPTTTSNVYDVKVKMGHNDPDPNKEIPAMVFFQGKPVKLIKLKGEMEETFTGIAVDPTNQKISGRIGLASDSSVGSSEIEVVVGQVVVKPAAEDLASYDLHYRIHQVAENHHRVFLIVRNDQYQSLASKIRISLSAPAVINDGDFKRGDVIDYDLPEDGVTWDFVSEARELKLHIFVGVLKKEYDPTIYGPRAEAPAAAPGDGIMAHLVAGWQEPGARLRFYWSFLPLLFLLTIWFGGFTAPTVTAVGLAVAVFLFLSNEAAAYKANQYFGWVMKTNNQWWATWLVTTIAGTFLTLFLGFWGPSAPEPLAEETTTAQTAANESEQRQKNLEQHGIAVIDQEIKELQDLGLLKAPATPRQPPQKPSGPSAIQRSGNWVMRWVLPDQSLLWGWVKRLVALVVLILTTLVYAIFAFKDDVAIRMEKRREQAGGGRSIFQSVLQMISGAAKNPPRSTGQRAPSSGSEVPKWLLWLTVLGELAEWVRPILRILGIKK